MRRSHHLGRHALLGTDGRVIGVHEDVGARVVVVVRGLVHGGCGRGNAHPAISAAPAVRCLLLHSVYLLVLAGHPPGARAQMAVDGQLERLVFAQLARIERILRAWLLLVERVVFEVLIKHGQSGVRSSCLIKLMLVGRHCIAHARFSANLICCFELWVPLCSERRTRRVRQGKEASAVFLIGRLREKVALATAALRMRCLLRTGRLVILALHLRFRVVHARGGLVARRRKHDDRDLLARILRVDDLLQLVLHIVHGSLVLRLLWLCDLIALRHDLHFDHDFILPS